MNTILTTIWMVVLVNGDIHQECARSKDAAWYASIDYVMEDIDYIEGTGIPCETGDL